MPRPKRRQDTEPESAPAPKSLRAETPAPHSLAGFSIPVLPSRPVKSATPQPQALRSSEYIVAPGQAREDVVDDAHAPAAEDDTTAEARSDELEDFVTNMSRSSDSTAVPLSRSEGSSSASEGASAGDNTGGTVSLTQARRKAIEEIERRWGLRPGDALAADLHPRKMHMFPSHQDWGALPDFAWEKWLLTGLARLSRFGDLQEMHQLLVAKRDER